MWDRRRTATGPSTSSLSSRHKQRLASHRHLQNQPLLDSDPNTPFNALGISNAVYKYRVHAGKVVPDLYNSELPSSPHEDHLEYQHQTILPSDLADQPSPSRISRTLSALFKSDTESDLYQGVVRTDQMSAAISNRMAPGQISPPSSPEVVAWRSSPEGEDVSPIDDDSDTLDGSNSPRVRRGKSNKLQPKANRQPSYRDKPAAPLPQHAIPPRNSSQSSPPQQNPQRLAPMQQSHQLPHRPPQPQFDRAHAPPVSLGQRMKRLAKPRPDVSYPQPLAPSSHNQSPHATVSRNNPAITPLNIPSHQPSRRPVATGPPPAGHPAFNTAKPDSKRVSTAMRKLLPVKESAPIGTAVSYYPPNRSYPSPPHDDMIPPPQAQQPPHPAPAGAHSLSSMNSLRRKPPPTAKMGRSSAHANPLGSSPVYSSESDDAKRRGSGSAAPKRDVHTTPKEKIMAPSISTGAERETPLSIDTVSRQPRVEHSRAISDSPLAMKSPPLDYSESPQGSPMQLKPAKARPASAMLSPIRNDSAADKAKPLPPAPPEATAVDRISQMNAQLSALANRRVNLNRGIKQMTELMPPDNSINVDVLIRREEEKKKIEALKADLADIQREEHELGMRLHRAYKRQNKDEPTTLWVRRVTG